MLSSQLGWVADLCPDDHAGGIGLRGADRDEPGVCASRREGGGRGAPWAAGRHEPSRRGTARGEAAAWGRRKLVDPREKRDGGRQQHGEHPILPDAQHRLDLGAAEGDGPTDRGLPGGQGLSPGVW